MICGAAVDVVARGVGHHLRVGAGDLHRDRRGLAVVVGAARGLERVPQILARRHHLADRVARAQALAQHAERPVRHPGHGGDEQGIRQLDRANVHGVGSGGGGGQRACCRAGSGTARGAAKRGRSIAGRRRRVRRRATRRRANPHARRAGGRARAQCGRMDHWFAGVVAWLSLPQYGLLTLFVVALVSATLLPLGSEPALAGLVLLNPSLIWWAILVATLGNTIGGAISWATGYGAERAYESLAHKKPPGPASRRALALRRPLRRRAPACSAGCRWSAIRCARSPAGCGCRSGPAWATWRSASSCATWSTRRPCSWGSGRTCSRGCSCTAACRLADCSAPCPAWHVRRANAGYRANGESASMRAGDNAARRLRRTMQHDRQQSTLREPP